MRFRIHYTLPNGIADSVVVTGNDIDEIREAAVFEVKKRNGKDAWSEEL